MAFGWLDEGFRGILVVVDWTYTWLADEGEVKTDVVVVEGKGQSELFVAKQTKLNKEIQEGEFSRPNSLMFHSSHHLVESLTGVPLTPVGHFNRSNHSARDHDSLFW